MGMGAPDVQQGWVFSWLKVGFIWCRSVGGTRSTKALTRVSGGWYWSRGPWRLQCRPLRRGRCRTGCRGGNSIDGSSAFKRSRTPPLTIRNRAPRHLLEVLEAGVGLEGLGDCSAAHFAEINVGQAQKRCWVSHQHSNCPGPPSPDF